MKIWEIDQRTAEGGICIGWTADERQLYGSIAHESAIEMRGEDKEELERYAAVVRDALNDFERKRCPTCGK